MNIQDYRAKVVKLWKDCDADFKPLRKEFDAKVAKLWEDHDAKLAQLRHEYYESIERR